MSTDDKNYDQTDDTVVIDTPGDVEHARAPRQQISVPHLVMGLVFLGIAAAWALQAAGVIASVEVQWVVPGILVVAGAAGLLVSLTRAGKGVARPSSGA